ncbi:MAG TPA: DUF6049 family protein [Nocardioides sp.]|uniref:DUF6049 family protein n=1 Tax=Nocardioides sp. TaxID=35761 RepID=UPI002D7FA01E|nr:DUF6049 family protein [Nocardioides sp.]HET6652442.1 DUF6049 family protein [Nocardioides sp.]
MTRPVIARAAACLARGVLAGVVAAVALALTLGFAPGATAPAAALPRGGVDDSPLGVTLDTLTPSVIPQSGPITIRGEVTNRSEDTYTDLQVYLFHSQSPITSRASLAEAVTTDPETDVGPRVTPEGRFDEIGDLEPGETTSYSVTVRRRDLAITGDPGVYWVGAHVLGAVDGVRTGLAAGRARSFMPLVPATAPTADLGIVVPLRERVRRGADGSLLGLGHWQRSLVSDGRLGRIGQFAAGSSGPLSWLVDPAVLDAVGSVAADDPPRFIGPDGTGPGQNEPSESASESPSETADPGDSEGSDDEETDEPSAEAENARSWLDAFVADVQDDAVLALPYGDVDVPAFNGNQLHGTVRQAQRLSADTMAGLEVEMTPAVAPPAGYLPGRALSRVAPDTAVLMSDLAMPTVEDTVVSRPDGTRVVLTDTAAASGGPGPQSRTNLLALRQRILSDLALTALAGDTRQPVVVTLPSGFDPGEDWQTADFFGGLDQPWLRQIDLDELLADGPFPASDQAPLYPASQRDLHVPLANQLATRELGEVGRVYAELLSDNDSVADELAKQGMLASSYFVRRRPGAALNRTRNAAVSVRRTWQEVNVDGPPFVRMTSQTGPISITVENGLDVPVTVGLEATTRDPELTIATPEPINLGPGERAPIRLQADANSIGVHTVTIAATTEQGSRLGADTQFTVRTSNVGTFVWIVVGLGFAVLAVAIVIRLVRRVRAAAARRAGGPDDPGDDPGTGPGGDGEQQASRPVEGATS